MIIDVHCHYTLTRRPATTAERFTFEPAAPPADAPLPTAFDSCVSDRALRRWSWRAARWWLKLPPPGPALDAHLEQQYAAHLHAPGPITRYVLLAFDAVHDDAGQCVPLPPPGDRFGSDIYTSNSLIHALCRSHPERFLFGASVHPYRAHADDAVREVFAHGACLLKWLPRHQNIRFDDPRTRAVLRVCATLGLPVLVHVGPEFTLTTQQRAGTDLPALLDALRALRRDDALPTTIVAHLATPVTAGSSGRDFHLLLKALTGEFADAPLFGDISALVAFAKVGYLRRILRRPELHSRLLFGSDFPIPPALFRLRGRLGPAYATLRRVPSWPQQAALAYRTLGVQDIALQRATTLLPNLHHFTAGKTPAA